MLRDQGNRNGAMSARGLTAAAVLLFPLAWGACSGPADRDANGGNFTDRTREAPHGGDAAHLAWLEASYEKSSHMVPMRDGVELFTIVYRPREISGPLPVMLFRTPYSVGPTNPARTATPWARPPSSTAPATSSSSRTCADSSCPRATSR